MEALIMTTTEKGPNEAAKPSPQAALLQLLAGGLVVQLVQAAAKLGIADHLAASPLRADELAPRVSAHAPSLARVLRALTAYGVLTQDAQGRFALTDIGQCLRSDVPGSLRASTLFWGDETVVRAMTGLPHSLRTGETAFDKIFGRAVFDYMTDHPDFGRTFDARSTESAGRAVAAVVKAYDFSKVDTVVDIGGSQGGMLAAILGANPNARGVLFDLPATVASAQPVLERANVLERCRVIGGSFFENVPTGGDVYVLKSILHDWDDEKSIAILRNCAKAMKPDARLLLVERVIPAVGPTPLDTIITDVAMLLVTGGRERTESEYRALLQAAGMRITRVVPTTTSAAIVEAALA
jgi:hypothetical protein